LSLTVTDNGPNRMISPFSVSVYVPVPSITHIFLNLLLQLYLHQQKTTKTKI